MATTNTAAQAPMRPRPGATGGPGTSFARTLRSEAIKFTTVPSTLVLVLATVVVMMGFAALAAWGIGSVAEMGATDPEMTGGEDVTGMANTIASSGIMFAQLIVGSLAVIVMSSEFTTGMARATFAAGPRRYPVVLAKALLVAVVAFVVTAVSIALSALLIGPILNHYGLSQDMSSDVFQQNLWIGSAYVAAIALIGFSLGGLLRNSAGGIVTLVGLIFVLPIVLSILSTDFITKIRRFLPSEAYNNLVFGQAMEGALEQWQAWLTLGLWAGIPLLAAVLVIQRRDV